MAAVVLSGVSQSYGATQILDNLNFSLAKGEKIALTGANGSGKTTLMKIIAGAIVPEFGKVVCEKRTTISYMPQSRVVLSERTLYEEAECAFSRFRILDEELRAIEEKLALLKEKPQKVQNF